MPRAAQIAIAVGDAAHARGLVIDDQDRGQFVLAIQRQSAAGDLLARLPDMKIEPEPVLLDFHPATRA